MIETPRQFLVLGCQRSGTTLLGMALEVHPRIAFFDEDDRRFHCQGDLTLQLDVAAVSDCRDPAEPRIGFKAPRDTHRIGAIRAALGPIQLVWITRQVYSVVASMLTLKTASEASWALRFAPLEIVKFLQAKGATGAYADEFRRSSSLHNARQRAVALATLCWLVKRESECQATKPHPDRVHRVAYEQLALKPRETMAAVLQFLGLEWDDAVLDHSENLSGVRPGGASTQRSIDGRSRYRWARSLCRHDLASIDAILARHPAQCSV